MGAGGGAPITVTGNPGLALLLNASWYDGHSFALLLTLTRDLVRSLVFESTTAAAAAAAAAACCAPSQVCANGDSAQAGGRAQSLRNGHLISQHEWLQWPYFLGYGHMGCSELADVWS
jgi:hypothetical protein